MNACPRCGARLTAVPATSPSCPACGASSALAPSGAGGARVIAANMPAAAQGRVATYRLPELGGAPTKHEPTSAPDSNEPSHGIDHAASAETALKRTPLDAPAVGQAALKGVKTAGRFGVWLLAVADRIDRAFQGWRAVLLLIASGFVVLSPWLAEQVGRVRLPDMALVAFAFVCAVLMLARLHRLRDERGFQLALLRVEAELLLETLANTWDVVKAGSVGSNLRKLGGTGMGAGVVLMAAAQLVALILPEIETLASFPQYLFGGSVLLWVLGWYLGRTRLSHSSLAVTDSNLDEVKASVLGLPCLVDCRDQEAVVALAGTCDHPLVRQLMLELGGWRPNKARYERVYQQRLLNRLRTRMADADPQKEVWIGDGGSAGRVDLVLAKSVIVEVKVNPSSTEIDRAVGQVRKYLTVWTKGPVLLLLCNADRSSARRAIEPQLQQMRDQGLPVVGVLARG